MEEKWVITAKRADFYDIGRTFRLDPVVARLIRNRDVVGNEAIDRYLNGTLKDLSDPRSMRGMAEAVSILKDKIAGGARMRVVGDYDIDGVMAAYLLCEGLKSLGANVDAAIPHRVIDGYGISERLIRCAAEDGVDTIITCDNGVSAWEPLRLAKELGLTVIVTDHHEVIRLPGADAVIDPHQEGCPYPYKELCGAAVAWRLLDVMNCPLVDDLLPYAAFATVGDIVDLTGENRIIVKEGLKALRSCSNRGMRMLARVNDLSLNDIEPYHIGYILGPCLNAAGRLESADLALHLLQSRSDDEALDMASRLKALNDRRKAMTEDGVTLAEEQLEKNGERDRAIYVVHLENVHESIAGIIAGRLREAHEHPVFVLTGTGEIVKGSGRSVEAYPLIEGLKACDELLVKYGGHRMAAGLSLRRENVEAFRRQINDVCGLTKEDLIPKVRIDAAMPMSYVTEDLIRQIDLLRPFGKGNPEPLFAMKDVTAEQVRILGRDRHVLKMTLQEENGYKCEAIAFKDADGFKEQLEKDRTVTVAYYPSVNEFRGVRTLQAVITHYRRN